LPTSQMKLQKEQQPPKYVWHRGTISGPKNELARIKFSTNVFPVPPGPSMK
jgi:hypothetical protein